MKRSLLVVAGALAAATSYGQVTSGLVAKYSFDAQNTFDESGHQNDGTPFNLTGATDRFGNADYAYNFDGTSRIDLPNNLLLKDEITISMWFKTTSSGALIGQQDQPATQNPISRFVPHLYVREDNKLNAHIWSNNPSSGLTINDDASAMTDGVWHHVVLTGNTTEQRLYIDNTLSGTGNGTLLLSSMIYNQIGTGYTSGLWQSSPNSYFPFVGSIDDVWIYDRMLAPTEVSALYHAPNPAATDLIAKYSFDAQNTLDESGNDNDGTSLNLAGATDRFGNDNYAYAFNGTSRIALPTGMLAQEAVSVSMWFKTTEGGVLIGKQEEAAPSTDFTRYVPFLYVREDNRLNAQFWSTGVEPDYNINNSLIDLADGAWHHVVVTGDTSEQRVYIDNVLSGTGNDALIRTEIYAQIGTGYTSDWPSSPSGYFSFEGSIDDVHIYGRAISADEVDSLYNAIDPASVTSLAGETATRLAVYPNPVTDYLTVSGADVGATAELVDLQGRTVLRERLSQGRIGTASLAEGFYFLLVKDRRGAIVGRQKVVKR